MSTVRLEAVKTDMSQVTTDTGAREGAAAQAASNQEIPMQPASADIWDKKYRLKTKKGDADRRRPSTTPTSAWPRRWPTPSPPPRSRPTGTSASCGRCAAGRSRPAASPPTPARSSTSPRTSTINCTVSGTITDSMDGILDKVHEAGLTLKAGCGIGYEFSTLRPRGAYVAGAGAYTSGPAVASWISTTRCVSPCPRPAAAAARRWARSTSAIRT